jgi:hypothetical protein
MLKAPCFIIPTFGRAGENFYRWYLMNLACYCTTVNNTITIKSKAIPITGHEAP